MSQIQTYVKKIEQLSYEVRKVLVGQEEMLEALMVAVLSKGHVLVEGVPGLAKTVTINTLAKALGLPFKRIQFTPDLLPADIIGTEIFDQNQQQFKTSYGPIFANFVLADEINRAPAKVQSALLEAMQERQVTIGKQTYKLDQPFLVMATQNPVEQEGTYQLPEAQLDRFLMKVNISYPTPNEEYTILQRVVVNNFEEVQAVITKDELKEMIDFVKGIYIDPEIIKYIVNISITTRMLSENKALEHLSRFVDYGASPRGAISLATISKAKAFLAGRDYVTPGDVADGAKDALRHRIIMSYVALAEGVSSDHVIAEVVKTIAQPKIDVSRKDKE